MSLTIEELQKRAYKTAVDKGWHETKWRQAYEAIYNMLIENKYMPFESRVLATDLSCNLRDAGVLEDRSVGDLLALIHSEVSEALEEVRNGRPLHVITYEANGKPCGFPIELADILIRVGDLAEKYNINLTSALLVKMKYNTTRPHRHGGKKL